MKLETRLSDLRVSTLILFVIVIPASMICFACGGIPSRASEPLDVVPAEAVGVVAVDWRVIRGDAGLRRMASGDNVEKSLQDVGIASSEVQALVYYSDGRNPREGISGLIIVGPGSKAVMMRLAERGWSREETTAGISLRSPADGSCAAAVDRKMLVLGTPAGVRSALGARRAPQNRLWANPTVTRLMEASGTDEAPLRALVVVPAAIQDAGDVLGNAVSAVLDLTGLGLVTDLVGNLGVSRGLQMTCSRGEGGYPSHILAVMGDEEMARRTAGAITLVQGIGRLISPGNSEPGQGNAGPSLQDMTVTREGEVVSIRFTIPLDSL